VEPQIIASTPALAAALRTTDQPTAANPDLLALRPRALAPMYRVTGSAPAREIVDGVRAVEETADRLRRLATAYGEWRVFDAGAYFDLTPAQTGDLVWLTERVNTVHVRFFADLLLPSFQRAADYWRRAFAPAYAGLRHDLSEGLPTSPMPRNGLDTTAGLDFVAVKTEMIDRWRQARSMIEGVRDALDDSLTLVSMGGAREERNRWRHCWRTQPAPGVDPALLPPLAGLPTLTLTFDFPLPASRQPGRIRRLRRNRERRRFRR